MVGRSRRGPCFGDACANGGRRPDRGHEAFRACTPEYRKSWQENSEQSQSGHHFTHFWGPARSQTSMHQGLKTWLLMGCFSQVVALQDPLPLLGVATSSKRTSRLTSFVGTQNPTCHVLLGCSLDLATSRRVPCNTCTKHEPPHPE